MCNIIACPTFQDLKNVHVNQRIRLQLKYRSPIEGFIIPLTETMITVFNEKLIPVVNITLKDIVSLTQFN